LHARVHRRLHVLATLLLLALGLGWAPRAHAKVIRVPVDEFHETQKKRGDACAMLYVKHWKKEAKRLDLSLKQYAKRVLQPKLDGKLTPAVINPDGEVLNTDAHHHITAMLKLKELTGVTLVARAKLLKDYRGWSEKDYADHFVEVLKKGWFGRKHANDTPLEKMRSLPKTYAEMENDPLRSAVDAAFERVGLDGKMFTDYIEFRLGEALEDHGLYQRLRDKGLLDKRAGSIPDEDVFDKKIVKQITKMMRKGEVRQLLLDNARSRKNARQIEAALDD
jgi:hypothetical protein